MATGRLFVWLLLPVLSQGNGDCHCSLSSECVNYPDVDCTYCQVNWSGLKCQIFNFAKGDMKQTRLTEGGSDPDRVVDGEKRNHVTQLCTSISDENGVKASWTLILNNDHDIYRMRIYHYEGHAAALKVFDVHVTTELCLNMDSSTEPPSPLDVTCSGPITGRSVTISTPTSPLEFFILALCEVELYECGDYWWGEVCDQRCNCVDASEVCDQFDGWCASGTRETTTSTAAINTTTTSTTTSTTTKAAIVIGNQDGSSDETVPTSTEANLNPSAAAQVGVSLEEIAGVVVGVVIGFAVIFTIVIIVVIKTRQIRRPKVASKVPEIKVIPVNINHNVYEDATKLPDKGDNGDKGDNYYSIPKDVMAARDYERLQTSTFQPQPPSPQTSIKTLQEEEENVYEKLDDDYLAPVPLGNDKY